MKLRLGRKNKGPEIITLGNFVTAANEKLSLADKRHSTLDESVAAAESLAGQIKRIREGTLEVQPPIALADLDAYDHRAGTIISLGQKATQHLEQSAQSQQEVTSQASFSGTGGLAKSY